MTRYEVELTDDEARGLLNLADCATKHEAILLKAVRANPPKPPRMPEPAWRPQVTAYTADNMGRRGFSAEPWANGGAWVDARGGRYRWSELLDPEPVDGAS